MSWLLATTAVLMGILFSWYVVVVWIDHFEVPRWSAVVLIAIGIIQITLCGVQLIASQVSAVDTYLLWVTIAVSGGLIGTQMLTLARSRPAGAGAS